MQINTLANIGCKNLQKFKPNKFFIAFIVGAFAFMPYSFNLVTYFSPDFYLELYLVWLMYAYKKDNQLMVSFIGFLLCFTKDTGAFVYGFFMLSSTRASNGGNLKIYHLVNSFFG